MSLSILNYHGLQGDSKAYTWSSGESVYVLSSGEFEKHLNLICDLKLHTLNLEDLSVWLNSASEISSKSTVLTFDDGHISHFDLAYPALQERGLKAIFFISAAFVGKGEFMDWGHLNELTQAGFEIGSHGLTHQPLTHLSAEEIRRELQDSKNLLQDNLGVEIASFSVPRGYYNSHVERAAINAGYKYVFTSNFSTVEKGHNCYQLGRLAVTPQITISKLTHWLEGQLGAQKYTELLKTKLRNSVAPSIYDSLAVLRRGTR